MTRREIKGIGVVQVPFRVLRLDRTVNPPANRFNRFTIAPLQNPCYCSRFLPTITLPRIVDAVRSNTRNQLRKRKIFHVSSCTPLSSSRYSSSQKHTV